MMLCYAALHARACACRSSAMQQLPASWCSGSQTGSGGPRKRSLQQAPRNARESQTQIMTAMVPSWCVTVRGTAWQGFLHSCKLSWHMYPELACRRMMQLVLHCILQG